MNKITNNKIIKDYSIKYIFTSSILSIFFLLPIHIFASNVNGINRMVNNVQQKNITININNKGLDIVLNEICRLYNKRYILKKGVLLDKNSKFSLKVTNVSLETALSALLNNSNYTFKIYNDNIVIEYKVTDTHKTDNKEILFTGKIVDKSDNPLAGVVIVIQNSNKGTITDVKGKFALKAVTGDICDVSYAGMKNHIFTVDASSNGTIIELESDVLDLDDVVITGIFKKTRESYVGSVTSITEKELKMFKGQNLLQTLRNIDPALNIVQNNNIGSDPNKIPEINVRGNSSLPTSIGELNEGVSSQLNAPLVIMDGFEISIKRLMDFNDEDLESINILKDASATAIYGSRGANGVIVITSKKPVAGKLNVTASVGVNIEIPDLSSYNLLNAREKLELENNIGIYSSNNPNIDIALKRRYNQILKDVNEGVNTYWLSQPLRVGVGQRYMARIGGGSDAFRWGVSLNHNSTLGVMKETKKTVFDGSVNLSYTHKNLLFQNNLLINKNHGDNGSYGSFSEYTKLNPYWRPTYDNGSMVSRWQDENGNYSYKNPLYNTQFKHKNYNDNTVLSNMFSLNWTIIDGLVAMGKFGITKSFSTSDKFTPAQNTIYEDYGDDNYHRKGSYIYGTGQSFDYDAGVTISYSKMFDNKHLLYVGLDYTLMERSSYNYNISAEGFLDDDFNFLANGTSYAQGGKPNGSESKTRSLGLTANINYTYCHKYFVDASIRMDGASQFGRDSRFAPFYSAGLGWNIHNEKLLKKYSQINNLRLKFSYGRSGSQQFSAYKSLTMYDYFLNDQYMFWNAVGLTNFGNSNLKWQTTDQYNLGFEIAMFNNRISASLDIYNKSTKALLSELDIPKVTGFSSYTENIGSVNNKGIEAAISGYIIRNASKNIMWSVSAKIANNKNKINKLSDAIIKQNEKYLAENENDGIKLLYEGYSQSALYAVTSIGIDPSNGMEVFLDKDGKMTYSYNPNALKYIGESEPRFRGNISSMFSYKNLSINVSFGYHWGGKQYNQTLVDRVEVTKYQTRYNVDRRVFEDRWMKPGDKAFFKGYFDIYGNESPATRMSSRFIQNDNMFSLQSLSIQYRIVNRWVNETLKLQNINVSANMSDLFYISTIKRERGLAYPFSRRVSFSLGIVF